jgi:VWFA-related protein
MYWAIDPAGYHSRRTATAIATRGKKSADQLSNGAEGLGIRYKVRFMCFTSPWKATARLAILVALAASALSFGAPSRGQEAPAGPIHPKAGVPPEQVPPSELAKQAIRVRVSEVTAPVTVRDASGEMVLDLLQDNFHVFDNGAEQKLNHFDVGGDPLSIVLLVETSSHIEPMFPAIQHVGAVFTEAVMGTTSEAAVLSFDNSVDTRLKFTTDPDDVQNTVNHMQIGSDEVLLYDAMAKGIAMLDERPKVRRKILVVVSEAQDSGSEAKLGEVLRQAQLANVMIYSIGLSTAVADLRGKPKPKAVPQVGPTGANTGPPNTTIGAASANPQGIDLMPLVIWLVKTGKNAVGPNSLAIASQATGGLHVNVKRDGSIQKAMDEIGGELHAQYTLAYRPTGEDLTGYHEIKVVVDRANVTVRTRPGYYIPDVP